MEYIRAVILGVVQAVTEFLPISSSAHLILFRKWMGFESVDGLTFDVAVHIGTVLALIVYFRRDLSALGRGFAGTFVARDLGSGLYRRLAWYIIAATIPAALAGLIFSDIIERLLRQPAVIVVTLIAGGVLFLAAERWSKQTRSIDGLSLARCLTIGLAQSLALIPGVSRSGITIVAGMALNLRRTEAARFGFLLSVPVMLGAGLKKAIDIQQLSLGAYEVGILVTGVATAAAAGWLVIKFFLAFLHSHRLHAFAYYRFGLALLTLAWLRF